MTLLVVLPNVFLNECGRFDQVGFQWRRMNADNEQGEKAGHFWRAISYERAAGLLCSQRNTSTRLRGWRNRLFALCTAPEMIPNPVMIPKLTPKWSPFLFTSTPNWSPFNFRNGMMSKNWAKCTTLITFPLIIFTCLHSSNWIKTKILFNTQSLVYF